MVLETYPLDNVDYSAEDAELFHCTRSSGIYANDDFDYSVTGADNTITIGVGLGWIRNSKFSGKVVALKAAMTLDMGLPDAVYPRIDAVVIQFDANKNGTEIVVKRGVAASAPAAPAISKTESLYELHLYHVRREPGASAVSVSNITDLRLDPNYCGLMADSVTQIDTAAISAQVNALIESLRQEIQSVKDGSAYLLRSGGEMSGPINMNGQPISGLNAPTANDQAANKGYVDSVGNGKLSMELRWKNASPTSSFVAQTVSVDLSDGEMCRVVFNGNVQDTNMKVHDAPIGYMTWLHSEWNSRFVREAMVRTNSIDFGVGKAGAFDAFVEENNVVCVPVEIYVVKGVSL